MGELAERRGEELRAALLRGAARAGHRHRTILGSPPTLSTRLDRWADRRRVDRPSVYSLLAERLESMGRAYREMLADRELLQSQMQLYAACSDPEIREVAREGFRLLVGEVARLSGASGPALQQFFAMGMLLNVAASIDFPALGDREHW